MNKLSVYMCFKGSAYAVVEVNPQKFSGVWVAVQEGNSGDKMPYSTFEISLRVEDRKVEGSYCYVTRYGSKIDCDPEAENILGAVNVNTGVANLRFSSLLGAAEGVGTLTRRALKLSATPHPPVRWRDVLYRTQH